MRISNHGTVFHRKRWELFWNCPKGGKVCTLIKFSFLTKNLFAHEKNAVIFGQPSIFCYRASFSHLSIIFEMFIQYSVHILARLKLKSSCRASRFNWQYRITRSTSPLLFNTTIRKVSSRIKEFDKYTHAGNFSYPIVATWFTRVPVYRERGSLTERSTNRRGEWASIESRLLLSLSVQSNRIAHLHEIYGQAIF